MFDHRFRPIRDEANVPAASLHRLRHSVATFLVNRGEIVQAQARLGHSDPATTLRIYAHALPLTDTNIAGAINEQLDQPRRRPQQPDQRQPQEQLTRSVPPGQQTA